MYFDKWDLRFLNLACEVASWSKDDSTKVGCVITTEDHRIVSTGYNGLPRGAIDDKESIPDRHDREKDKYLYYEHAERNAIYNAAYKGIALKDCVAYITMAPCMNCARGLIQSGLKRVVFIRETDETLI